MKAVPFITLPPTYVENLSQLLGIEGILQIKTETAEFRLNYKLVSLLRI